MIRLTSFAGLLISLVVCNPRDDRILRPTPIPALRSPFATSGPMSGVITGGEEVRVTFKTNPRSYQLTGPSNGTFGLYEFVASHSQKCLDASGWSVDDGTPLIQWDCHGGDNQLWSVEATAVGAFRIVSRHSGKCLDVNAWSTDDGTSVIQWQCYGGENQQWRLEAATEGYRLLARHSGKCLDVSGMSKEDGASIIQSQCHGGASQTWLLRPVTTPPPLQPLDDYTGVYTLTITARSCAPGFPEAAQRRVYTARVEQTGANVWVSLSGADFLPGSNTFTGAVEPTGEITFWILPISWWEFYGADLEERLSDGTVLMIFGTIQATGTPAGMSGTAGSDASQEAGLGGILHFLRGSSSSLNNASSWCNIDCFEMVPQ